MLERDVLLSKINIVRNCLNRIDSATKGDVELLSDFDVQDVVVLNLQRAIQACVDAGNIQVARHALGLPSTYKMTFSLLAGKGHLDFELADAMGKMVGFRNIAVHEYQEINLNILKAIVKLRLPDFAHFCQAVAAWANEPDESASGT